MARAGYSASRHALHGFFDTLRAELNGTGVGVLLVCPSFIATAIRDRSLPEGRSVGGESSPESVAAKIFTAAERGKRRLATERIGRLAF